MWLKQQSKSQKKRGWGQRGNLRIDMVRQGQTYRASCAFLKICIFTLSKMGCHWEVLNKDVLRLKKKKGGGGRADIIGPHRERTNDDGDLIAFVSTSCLDLFTPVSVSEHCTPGLKQTHFLPGWKTQRYLGMDFCHRLL